MRRAAKIDANQREIVAFARSIPGVSVHSMAQLGEGAPDLALGWRGRNYFVEVKDGKGKLTPAQVRWHAAWSGQVAVVRDVADLCDLLGLPS